MDGKEYIKIEPGSETQKFMNSKDQSLDGTFAIIKDEDL